MIPWTRMIQLPNGISIGSVIFAQLARVTNTQAHRQTDAQTTLRATSIATGRICTLRAGDAA